MQKLCVIFSTFSRNKHLQVTAILNPPSELYLNRVILVLN